MNIISTTFGRIFHPEHSDAFSFLLKVNDISTFIFFNNIFTLLQIFPYFYLQAEQRRAFFLSTEEEQKLLRSYEYNLKEFCRRFDPPMPKCVVGTAFHYFKRFYLYNSAMDYHPKEILYVWFYFLNFNIRKCSKFNQKILRIDLLNENDKLTAIFQGYMCLPRV